MTRFDLNSIPITCDLPTNSTSFTLPSNHKILLIDKIEIRMTRENDFYFWKNTKYFDNKFENCGGYLP